MSAPLFIRTPYMSAKSTTPTDGQPAYETVASHGSEETTTLLIETLRYWYAPPGLGGRSAGYLQLAVLTPEADLVSLERHEVAALAEDEYAGPVNIRLDLLLPPGQALQIISSPLDNMAAFTAACHVVVQGGELG